MDINEPMHMAKADMSEPLRPDRVVLLTSMDGVTRDLAAFCAGDGPDVCVIRYRVERRFMGMEQSDDDSHSIMHEGCLSDVAIVRTVQGCSLVTHGEERFAMPGCCVTCAIKSDVERMIVGLGNAIRRCGVCTGVTFVVVLPVGLQAFPIAQYLDDCFSFADDLGDNGTVTPVPRVAAVATVVNEVGLRDRLFDDAPFESDDGDVVIVDERSVGEVEALLLREASHVLTISAWTGEIDEPDCGSMWMGELIGQIRSSDDAKIECACDVDWRALASGSYSLDGAQRRLDALSLRRSCDSPVQTHMPVRLECSRDGFEATVVHSPRPVHPGRLSTLLNEIETPVHIRGHFTVPTKPFSVFVWEGGPGGVSIEELDNIEGDLPAETILQIVSAVHTDIPLRLEWLLLTDDELRMPTTSWFDQADEFTAWSNAAHR
ncbi:hypothetical protein KIH77_10060 [Bifidobacterium sp. 82T24]|uniref:hypothetical protein n=1 Tax=Bifidobacterium pluvialisilvae TaxID=2834436 RepID=UPI001C593716|nr:hypothetical protein [Bifidobacterium pluvialisilvae]MBW3089055.1 hypothetical protein [Bifidobacterium pluvialisilvae]